MSTIPAALCTQHQLQETGLRSSGTTTVYWQLWKAGGYTLRSRKILIYFYCMLMDPQSTQSFYLHSTEDQNGSPGCCKFNLEPSIRVLSVESIFAMDHLTFPRIKTCFILCNSSSKQHFNQSSFQKIGLEGRLTTAVRKHRKRTERRKNNEQDLPNAHKNTPRLFSLFLSFVYFAIASRISKICLSLFFPPWDRILSILTAAKEIIKNE